MADYISREALTEAFENADADVCESHPDGYCDWGFGRENIREVIAGVPAADVEPVVSCKGCEHAERYERTDGTAGYYCGHPQNTFVYGERWDRVFKPVKKPDDFCSFGEPKEGGNENAAD